MLALNLKVKGTQFFAGKPSKLITGFLIFTSAGFTSVSVQPFVPVAISVTSKSPYLL